MISIPSRHAAPSALLPSSPGRLESGRLGRSPPHSQLWQFWTSNSQTSSPEALSLLSWQMSSATLQTSWWTSFSFSPFSFKSSAQHFLHDLISGPSYGVLMSAIFASPPVSFTFFWLPSIVRAAVPNNTWASGVGTPPPISHTGAIIPVLCPEFLSVLTVTTQFSLGCNPHPFWRARLFTCRCYTMYLKCLVIHSLIPPIKDCRGYAFLFSEASQLCILLHFYDLKAHFFLSLNNISLYECATVHLPIHLLKDIFFCCFFSIFIVIQLQLYAFSPHPCTPPHPSWTHLPPKRHLN